MSYYWFNRQELLQKANVIIVVVKKKLVNTIAKIKMPLKKKQVISIGNCMKNKKKQKENISKIGIKK